MGWESKKKVRRMKLMKDRKKKHKKKTSIFFSQMVKEKEKRTICKFRIGGSKIENKRVNAIPKLK